jgi:hypothetical protein
MPEQSRRLDVVVAAMQGQPLFAALRTVFTGRPLSPRFA